MQRRELDPIQKARAFFEDDNPRISPQQYPDLSSSGILLSGLPDGQLAPTNDLLLPPERELRDAERDLLTGYALGDVNIQKTKDGILVTPHAPNGYRLRDEESQMSAEFMLLWGIAIGNGQYLLNSKTYPFMLHSQTQLKHIKTVRSRVGPYFVGLAVGQHAEQHPYTLRFRQEVTALFSRTVFNTTYAPLTLGSLHRPRASSRHTAYSIQLNHSDELWNAIVRTATVSTLPSQALRFIQRPNRTPYPGVHSK